MAYKIRWSPRAASNLEDICNYIAKDSEHYASLFAKKVNAIIDLFPNFPKPEELFRNMEMRTYGKRFMRTTESSIALKEKLLR